MKFTFVIPVLNEEKFIGRCISSINSQSKMPFEVIVVDNGSNDKTVEISRKLGAKVVKEKKKGISNARNSGAKLAKGELVCFVDADGVLSKNWLRQAERIFQTEKVDSVSGLVFYSHKNALRRFWYNSYLLVAYPFLLLRQYLFGKPWIVGNNTVIKKEVFLELAGFDPVIGEDYWFTRKFARTRYKSFISMRMPIFYSSRGFDQTGYLKTLFYWAREGAKRASQNGYNYKNKD